MSYTVSEAKDVLSAFGTTYKTATANIARLKKELDVLKKDLNSAIVSGASAEVIAAKSASMNSKSLDVDTAFMYTKTLNQAKTSAENVLKIANNIPPASTLTSNPFLGPTGPVGVAGPLGPTGPQLSSFTSGIKISALSEAVYPASVSGNTITLDYGQASCFFTNAVFTGNTTIQIINVPYTTPNAIYSVTLIYPPTSNKYYGSTLKVSTSSSGLVTASNYTLGASANVVTSMANAYTYAVHQINIVNSAGTIVYLSSINGYAS